MHGGHRAGPTAAPDSVRSSLVIKSIVVVLLLALAVAIPVVLGQRGSSRRPVPLQGRSHPLSSDALGSTTTTVGFEAPARAYSPLQTAPAPPPSASTPPPPAASTTGAPTTAATEAPTTAASPPATVPEPRAEEIEAATVATGTPAPTPTAPPPLPQTVPPPTSAPPPASQTLTFTGGAVTLRSAPGSLTVVDARPAARYEAEVRQLGPASALVRFFGRLGWEDITFTVGGDGQPVAQRVFMPGTEADGAGY